MDKWIARIAKGLGAKRVGKLPHVGGGAFGMARLAILYAFDNPRRREHILLSDAEKDERRAAANVKMRELAFALAAAAQYS